MLHDKVAITKLVSQGPFHAGLSVLYARQGNKRAGRIGCGGAWCACLCAWGLGHTNERIGNPAPRVRWLAKALSSNTDIVDVWESVHLLVNSTR